MASTTAYSDICAFGSLALLTPIYAVFECVQQKNESRSWTSRLRDFFDVDVQESSDKLPANLFAKSERDDFGDVADVVR